MLRMRYLATVGAVEMAGAGCRAELQRFTSRQYFLAVHSLSMHSYSCLSACLQQYNSGNSLLDVQVSAPARLEPWTHV